MAPTMLTYKELSKRWRVPVNTLAVWVMQKRLKPIKLGRLVRFAESYIIEIETRGLSNAYKKMA